MSGEKWKVVLAMFLAVIAVSVGEAMVAKGMKQSAAANASASSAYFRGFLSPQALIGMVLMAAYFALYALSLQWADMSFVLPLTALSYLLGTLLAKYYLGETVTTTRWAGTLIITLGVIVVGLGERSGHARP